jgi:predicted PurR-regulated permease PerM
MTMAPRDPVPPESGAVSVVPEWLAVLASLSWRVVAIAGFLVVLWFLASILWTVTASIAVAVVISAVFAPWVVSLRGRGRSRGAAAGIVWAGALATLTGIALLLLLTFLPYLGQVVEAGSDAIAKAQAQMASLPVSDAAWASIKQAWSSAASSGGSAASSIVSSVAEVATVLVLATFLVFFFLRDGDKAWLWVFQAFSDTKRERITTAGQVALIRIGGYLRGTTILSGIIALTDLAFMLVLGVPLAVPLSVLVFLSGYIPYFGGIVTTGIVLLVTYSALGTGPVLVMLVLIAIRNSILSYGVRPAVLGRGARIHPAVVLIVLPAGFALAGVIGLFIAVPVAAVLMALRTAVLSILEPDPPPVLPGLIPAWLDRTAQWSWRLLAAVALAALLVMMITTLPVVFIPVLLATVLAATLNPLVRALVRRGRTRSRAAVIAVGGGFLAVTGILLVAVIALVGQVDEVAAGVSQGASTASAAVGGRLGLLGSLVDVGSGTVISAVTTIGGDLVAMATVTVLSCLLAFYFLRDGSQFTDGAFARAGSSAASLRPAASNAFEILGGYMSGTAIVSLVGAASQLAIMVVFGIPLALPVFVLSFFLGFIPYIGGFISTGIAFLLTVAFGTPEQIVFMAIWTLVFNIVTGNIVSPIVYGKTVHLHPAIVLVAIPAGGAIAGILGMFFVVPLAGVIAVLWRPIVAVMAAQAAPSTSQPPEPPAAPVPAEAADDRPSEGLTPA